MSEMKDTKQSRRKFLQRMGQGALAAGLATQVAPFVSAQERQPPASQPINLPPLSAPTERQRGEPPAPLPPAQRVGFAVVGLGHLALEEVLPAFGASKKAKLTALVSGSPDKARQVAAQYGVAENNIYNYQTYERLADNRDVQAVYIALPNSLHAEYTIRGARAGKHVLCEKPMAISVKECEQMIEACERANRKLMIGYRIQYEPHNRMAREMARNKQFGQVKYVDAMNGQRQGDPNQWRLDKERAGGGSLVDLGIYCLNTARFLLGEEPTEVSASIYTPPNDPRFREVEDLISFQMRFPSGVIVNSASSYDSHDANRYRVYATEGWFGLETAFRYRGTQMETARADGKVERVEKPQIEAKNQFATELDHLAECIMENKRPYTPGEEGLQDQRIMEAIYEAARTGRPVKLQASNKPDAFRGPEPSV